MNKRSGFTLIEMMAVVAIIAVLAAMAVPSYLFKVIREQIEGAIPLTDIVKKPIAMSWLATQTFPTDNAAAGLPSSDKIVNNYVSDVAIQDGAINITFGNRASGPLKGKILTLRPAVVTDAPVVPVTWVCAGAEAPDKMTIMGVDRTSIDQSHLPLACRRKGK
ncbi:MAG: pilin [Cytophaga sp.]|nr:pilin [Undibacterium sp.]